MNDKASVIEFTEFPWVYGSDHTRDGISTPWMQLHPDYVVGSAIRAPDNAVQVREGVKDDRMYPAWERPDPNDYPLTEAEENENCRRSLKCL